MSETQDLVARFTRAGTLKLRRPNQVERSHSNFNDIRVRSFVLGGSPIILRSDYLRERATATARSDATIAM